MKVAIVGSSGYIAQYLSRCLKKESQIESILKIDKTEDSDVFLDLLNADSFDFSVLDEIDYIVFTAAISGPDKCASEFELCWKINVTGTILFIREAIKRGCNILFFSSDAVFGESRTVVFDELSETKAITPYGKMKKAVEDTFRGCSGFKAIRLSYVASINDRFISYCLNCIRNDEVAEVFHPFYRNVTVISDVARIVLYFAFHWNDFDGQFINVVGKELVSRVRIADEINRITGNKLRYRISFPSTEFFANRPQITQVRSLYLPSMIEDNTFTEKIAKELEGLSI